jgi:hypothetical protein
LRTGPGGRGHTYDDYPPPWAIECSQEEWTQDEYACKRLWLGASGPWTGAGDRYTAKNIFDEAGLAQSWWTVAHIGSEWRPFAPFGQVAPFPHLPKAALWGDFQPVLNEMTLVCLADYLGVGDYPSSMTRVRMHSEMSDDVGPWATLRAAAWADVPNNGPYDPSYEPDTWFRVGRTGIGHRTTWSHPYYSFLVDCVRTMTLGFDLSPVWNAMRDPVRMLLYLRYRCGTGDGDTRAKVNCTFEVDISDDAGATWLTVKSLAATDDGVSRAAKVEIGSGTDYWSADFRIRFRYTGSEDADTPEWDDPGEEGDSGYCQAAMISYISILFEFDWEYKA